MIAWRAPLPDSSASEPSGLKIRSRATAPRASGGESSSTPSRAGSGVAVAQSAHCRGREREGEVGRLHDQVVVAECLPLLEPHLPRFRWTTGCRITTRSRIMPGAAGRRRSGCGRPRARCPCARRARCGRSSPGGWGATPRTPTRRCARCSRPIRSTCSPRTAWSVSRGWPGSSGRRATRSCASTGPRRSEHGRRPASARSRCATRCVRTVPGDRRSSPRCASGAPSRGAQVRFRPYWAFIGPFSRFIGTELLSAATRRAERTSSAAD